MFGIFLEATFGIMFFLINTYLAKFELKKDSLYGSLECPNPVERFRNLRNLKFMELRMKFLKAFGTI